MKVLINIYIIFFSFFFFLKFIIYDAREAELRDPHKNFSAAEVIFEWGMSVILANSYSIYCIKKKIFYKKEKQQYGLKNFLKEARNGFFPPCELKEKWGISEKTNKKISLYNKCYICESVFGEVFDLPQTTCNHYCESCDKWMHIKCQYLYKMHTSPPISSMLSQIKEGQQILDTKQQKRENNKAQKAKKIIDVTGK